MAAAEPSCQKSGGLIGRRCAAPLEDPEGAEAGRISQRRGLADAAAGPDGVEVADGGPARPRPAGPRRRGRRCRGARATRPGVRSSAAADGRRRAGRRATSQVMSCSPGRSSGSAAPPVGGVGAQPVRPRSRGQGGRGRRVVEDHDPPRAGRGRRAAAQPAPRLGPATGCARRALASGASRDAALDIGRPRAAASTSGPDRPPVEADPHLRPASLAALEQAEREVVEQLVGQHDHRAGGTAARRGAGSSGSADRHRPDALSPQRRASARPAPGRSASAHAGRSGADRAGQRPGPAPASTTDERVGPAQLAPTTRRARWRPPRRTAGRPRGW